MVHSAECGAGRDSPRVVRGGAFNNNQRNVRCAYRNRNNPNNRNNNQGFRVVGVGGGMAFFGRDIMGVVPAGNAARPRLRRRGVIRESARSRPGRALNSPRPADTPLLAHLSAARRGAGGEVRAGRIATGPRPGFTPGAGHLFHSLCGFVVGTQVPRQRTGVRTTNGRLVCNSCGLTGL